MTPIEKAAHEAAEEIQRNWFYSIPDKMPTAKSSMDIITKHLAPVQAELDAKDKLLQEASQIIEYIGTTGAERTDVLRKAQDWLARVKE